jgi:large subunit ribosomal protein L18
MYKKDINRKKRHFRIRKKIMGTPKVPRLSVRRSLTNLHVQLIDDISEKTIVGLSTQSEKVKSSVSYGGNKQAATVLGKALAEAIKEKGIERICFDRGGYQFHGRIKALADTLREAGIKF